VIKELFDGGVNMGVKTSIKQSQEALEIPITGIMDAKTIAKLNTIVG
jgi:lysozyme family protein